MARTSDEILQIVGAQLLSLQEEAEQHRIEYDARRERVSMTKETSEYWKGRRDEAGHFRDRLAEVRGTAIRVNAVGELVRAAAAVLKFRSKILLVMFPYQALMEELPFAFTDLQEAVHHIQQGSGSQPSDVGE
jgi:hypothetical protein